MTTRTFTQCASEIERIFSRTIPEDERLILKCILSGGHDVICSLFNAGLSGSAHFHQLCYNAANVYRERIHACRPSETEVAQYNSMMESLTRLADMLERARLSFPIELLKYSGRLN